MDEKYDEIKKNIAYYGTKCQELIEEICIRQPYDVETGKKNDLPNMIQKLGIDKEKVKYDEKDEEF